MTTVACTLVSLCVSLTLVSGLPAAKRLPLSHDSDDVLAGSDFLSVFMQRSDRLRTADRPDGPFEPHQYDRDLNSVSHKTTLLDLVKPYPQLSDKYTISNIYKTNKFGYAVNEMATDLEDYQITTPDVNPTLESEVKTTTLFTEPTTIEDIPTTAEFAFDKIITNISMDDPKTTVVAYSEPSGSFETTTEPVVTDKVEEKVISVRVSSSVVRQSHRPSETSTERSASSDIASSEKHEDENLVSTLVTQEQPTITAVQRSEFAVEEASLSDSGAGDHEESKDSYERQDEVEGKVREVSLYSNDQQRKPSGTLPVFEIHFHNPPAALLSNLEVQRSEDAPVPTLRRKEFRQLSPYSHQSEPISYHSRVSSPTSDSSVKFYREHPRSNVRGMAETVNQPVLTNPYSPSTYQQAQDKSAEGTPGDYRETSTYHEEPRERTYGEPEKVYGQPEVNYEVDEAVSVITNGKAHGVQVPTPPPSQNPADNKFGYVVEGRNFRKYRVEERTADGFIVGEYGVVSHDDGSLRGVRYTADSNINPRLIYDTLVKFLSLK